MLADIKFNVEQVVIIIVHALAFFKAFRIFKTSGLVSSLSRKVPIPFSDFQL